MVKRPVGRRRGASGLGCLLSLVVVFALIYYGANLGRVWWRYWEIKDRMKTAARYALTQTDAQLLTQLQADAKEIGLPSEAARFRITRPAQPPSIVIKTEYKEKVELPLLHRTFVFRPEVVFRR